METQVIVDKYEQKMIDTRRQIHRNPELSNQEYNTTKLVKERLLACGVEIADIGLKTGVVGILHGKKSGKVLAIREDMDALPMQELTDLPFASANAGVCHSCGHDIHTAILLSCAEALSELTDEICGTIMFIFQPAEENITGAKQLISHDFTSIARPDTFIGLHVEPGITVGSIGLKKGSLCASHDIFRITIKGKGGHGAHPEKFVDPIMIAGYVLTQIQSVISRESHPLRPAVISICSIHGGTSANIMPENVEMQGTLRCLDPAERKNLQKAIERTVLSCCEGLRGCGIVTWEEGVPPMVNDADVVDGVYHAAEKIIGKENIIKLKDPSMGSEDFACFFPRFAPGAQFVLGTADPSDPSTQAGVHNPRCKFDERAMRIGCAVLVQYARDYLK